MDNRYFLEELPHPKGQHQMYRATLPSGEILINSTRDGVYDVARVLSEREETGLWMLYYLGDDEPSAKVHVRSASKLSVSFGRYRETVVSYVPFDPTHLRNLKGAVS